MKVMIIYESTRGRTKVMADAICEGVVSNGKECEVVDAKDFNGIGDSCAIAVGSSTRMKRTLPKTRQILAELQPLDGLPAAAFGSYGWSGEAPGEISTELQNRGAKMVGNQPLRVKDYPSEEDMEKCRELGRALAGSCV
ncbi:MAG: flavodoxin domain-containing protein [Candidatus Thorarchaeota archaeon]